MVVIDVKRGVALFSAADCATPTLPPEHFLYFGEADAVFSAIIAITLAEPLLRIRVALLGLSRPACLASTIPVVRTGRAPPAKWELLTELDLGALGAQLTARLL